MLTPDPDARAAPRSLPGQEREAASGGFGLFLLEGWMAAFPGLVAGTTLRPADFGLRSPDTAWAVGERFEALGRALGFPTIAVARQVHGVEVLVLEHEGLPGFHLCGEGDGLAGDRAGVLMTVTVADCVPVFLLDPRARAAALLHAGWRGAVEGILGKGIEALSRLTGSSAADFLLHLGPAICGDCYEVGPEVLSRFGLAARGPGPLDLRDRLAADGVDRGVPRDAISRSSSCTACDPLRLHSHRASKGAAGRMIAFIGHRAGSV
ncbi:MAG: polyphenol oxidase family protein [Gemmatimonadota bacterium]